MLQSQPEKNDRGFSIPEVLAVIAIIIIIMALLLPSFLSTKQAAYRAKCANRLHQLHVAAKARAFANHDAANKSCDARVDMDDGATGEIQSVHFVDQTVAVPNHVGDREVDKGNPQNDECHDGGKLYPLGKGADNEGRCDGGKGHLEAGEYKFRYNHTIGEGGGGGINGHAR